MHVLRCSSYLQSVLPSSCNSLQRVQQTMTTTINCNAIPDHRVCVFFVLCNYILLIMWTRNRQHQLCGNTRPKPFTALTGKGVKGRRSGISGRPEKDQEPTPKAIFEQRTFILSHDDSWATISPWQRTKTSSAHEDCEMRLKAPEKAPDLVKFHTQSCDVQYSTYIVYIYSMYIYSMFVYTVLKK